MDIILSIFMLLGGLALFLYGMNVMSVGLERTAGNKLESLLRKMTSNPFKALLLGTGITCAIQSSSAVTVMLVGLVNSGILEFGQTIGVLMGSNIGTSDYLNAPANIFIEGQPVGLLYGYKTDGIIQEGESAPKFEHGNESTYNNGPGGIRLVDPDGDGTVYSTERTILGDPNPDFSYGFGGTVSWKGLSASVNFYGVYGNEIVNQSNMLFYNTNDGTTNVLRKAYLDAWTPQNTDATMPRLRPGQAMSNYFIDYYIEDGSFLRLANVSLSYLIKFRKGSALKNMSIGASVSNAYVWTKYSGYDPEVNSYGYDMTREWTTAPSLVRGLIRLPLSLPSNSRYHEKDNHFSNHNAFLSGVLLGFPQGESYYESYR